MSEREVLKLFAATKRAGRKVFDRDIGAEWFGAIPATLPIARGQFDNERGALALFHHGAWMIAAKLRCCVLKPQHRWRRREYLVERLAKVEGAVEFGHFAALRTFTASAMRAVGQLARAAKLEPATPTEAMIELGTCLVLTGSTGMTEDTRTEWLKVAQRTLSDLPAYLLARGCAKARRTCQFPSQIVPCIIGEVEMAMDNRRHRLRSTMGPQSFVPPPKPDPEYVDPKLVRALINRIGGGE